MVDGSIYDPVTNAWTFGGTMSSGFRFSHATVSLLDGRVLAIGGSGGADPKSAETYNPSSGSWTLTGSLASERYSGFTATRLADGRVLVEGGTFTAVGVGGLPSCGGHLERRADGCQHSFPAHGDVAAEWEGPYRRWRSSVGWLVALGGGAAV
jgi:hypothetical protein